MVRALRGLLSTQLLACALCAVPTASAAQTRSAITGTVTDASGAVLPGVTVTLQSPNLPGGPRQTVTNAGGGFRFYELMPGEYEVTAALSGFRTVKRPGLRLDFGATAVVDLSLEVANLAETVTVAGASPIVDVTTAAPSLRLDDDLLQNIPLATDRRLVVNLMELAPGMYARTAFGGVRDGNALTADGVSISHPERAGISGSFGLNHNWIQEVQLVSLGANAEHGEFTGTATNLTLRSGSSRFSGLFDYWTTRSGWTGDNRGDLPEARRAAFRPQEILTNWDLTAQVGGPLYRDRLFFFAGFNYIRRSLVALGGSVPWDDRWPRGIVKVNWAPVAGVNVEGFVAPDRRRYTGGASGGPLRLDRRPETGEVLERPSAISNLRLTWTAGDRTLVEIRAGGLMFRESVDPAPPGNRAGPPPRQDQSTGIWSVNLPEFRDQRSSRAVAAATLTRYVDRRLGKSHEIKIGLEFERTANRSVEGFPGNRSFRDVGGAPSLVTLWDGSVIEGSGRRTTFFAQDKWTVGNQITLEPGLRWSLNRGSVPTRGTVFATNPVSPRLGLAWDVGGKHVTVVRAHYGRFHEGLFTGLYEFLHTEQQSPRITARVVGPETFVELNRFTPRGNLAIDENIRHAYVDQYLIGVERELAAGLSVQAQYVRRVFDDIFAFVDTRSIYQPVTRPDPGPDGIRNTADDGPALTVFELANPGAAFLMLTNPPEAFRRYDGMQLVAKRRYSDNWQFMGSYTLSKTEGSVNNQQGENAAVGADTGQAGAFVNPNRAINNVGRAELDFTHQVKLEGMYRMPLWGGVNASAVYSYVSGAAWGRTVLITGLRQGSETVRVEPRGTRRTGAVNQVDLRVEKTFELGAASRRVGVYFDVFNATNQGMPILRLVQPLFQASGPNLGAPRTWVDARTLVVGVRASF